MHNNINSKKLACLFFVTFLLIAMFSQLTRLSNYTNKIIVSSKSLNNNITSFLEENKDIKSVSYYKRNSCNLINGDKKVDSAYLYEVDNQYELLLNLKMIKGRFIYETDLKRGSLFVVISSKLAADLFATNDCIGFNLSIEEQNYTIIGVYSYEYSFVELISQTETHSVYIPRKSQADMAIVETENGYSHLIASALKNFNSDDIKMTVYDIGENANLAILVGKLFIFVSTLLYVLKFRFAINYNIRKYILKIRDDSKRYLFIISVEIGTIIFTFAIILLILSLFNLDIYIPIAFLEFSHKSLYDSIVDFFISNNIIENIISSDKILIRNLSNLLFIEGICTLFFSSLLLQTD